MWMNPPWSSRARILMIMIPQAEDQDALETNIKMKALQCSVVDVDMSDVWSSWCMYCSSSKLKLTTPVHDECIYACARNIEVFSQSSVGVEELHFGVKNHKNHIRNIKLFSGAVFEYSAYLRTSSSILVSAFFQSEN